MASSLDMLLHRDLVVEVVDTDKLAHQATPAVGQPSLTKHQSLLA